jgi:hypothetical protein
MFNWTGRALRRCDGSRGLFVRSERCARSASPTSVTRKLLAVIATCLRNAHGSLLRPEGTWPCDSGAQQRWIRCSGLKSHGSDDLRRPAGARRARREYQHRLARIWAGSQEPDEPSFDVKPAPTRMYATVRGLPGTLWRLLLGALLAAHRSATHGLRQRLEPLQRVERTGCAGSRQQGSSRRCSTLLRADGHRGRHGRLSFVFTHDAPVPTDCTSKAAHGSIRDRSVAARKHGAAPGRLGRPDRALGGRRVFQSRRDDGCVQINDPNSCTALQRLADTLSARGVLSAVRPALSEPMA